MDEAQVRGLDDAALEDLRRLVSIEMERRRALAWAKVEAERVASEYAAAVAGLPPTPLAEVSQAGVVGPGERIVDEQGVEWENTSGAWLSPHVAGPVAYPLGWARSGESAPDPQAVHEWDPDGHAYQVGDQVSYQGVVYQVVQSHTSQQGWAPDIVPALYTRA